MASPNDDIKKKMAAARGRFFGAAQGPRQTAPKPNRVPQRPQQGVGPVRVSSRVSTPKQPEFITAKTNPELSAQQARVINTARARGFESQKETLMANQGRLDNTYQTGLNADNTVTKTGQTQRTINRMQQEGLNDRQRNVFAQSLKEKALARGYATEDRDLTRQNLLEDNVSGFARDIYKETGDANLAAGIAAGHDSVDFNRAGGFTPTGAIDVKRFGGSAEDPIYGRVDSRSGQVMDPQLEAWLKARNKNRVIGLEDEEEL